MAPLLRRRANDAEGITPRRPQPGVLRRERRALLKAREDALSDLGGLLVEMYRRGGFRDDLLAERAATVVGIDARLAEIEELLHVRRQVPRCECGAPILRGSHFCPGCGRAPRRQRRLGGDGHRTGPRRPAVRALTSPKASERESAIAAADSTCPRCGAGREADETYCLECGLRLPRVTGRIPALRRSWIRRFGWYPGDWIWVSLLTLVVAAAGAATAIALTVQRTNDEVVVFTATTSGSVVAPVPVTPTTAVAPRPCRRRRSPDDDGEPREAGPKNGRVAVARPRERLDDRARLLPEGERPPARARRRRRRRPLGCTRSASSTRASTRAFSPATTWSSPASTARRRTRTQASRPPARRASAARTPARSPAERED